jgi:hypothetical protein
MAGIADDIPVDYIWCWDMRHAWNPDSMVSRQVFNRRIERWEIKRTIACYNCPSHKTQVLTTSHQLLRTDYDKPEDYSIRSGHRLTARDRAQIRARNIELHGGTQKVAKRPSNVTPIRGARKHA